MLRNILAAIAGYIAMAAVLFALFSLLWLTVGPSYRGRGRLVRIEKVERLAAHSRAAGVRVRRLLLMVPGSWNRSGARRLRSGLFRIWNI